MKKTTANHKKLVENLDFYKKEGHTKEEFKSKISLDFNEFKKHILKEKKQVKERMNNDAT